jgi:phosphoesterase RecJ-like protein
MLAVENFNKAKQLIEQSENIIITTHQKPDGDACGSVSALQTALKSQGKSVLPVFLTEIPEWYQFVFDEPKKSIESLEQIEKSIKTALNGKVDLTIIADTNSTRQLDYFCEYIKKNSDIPILIFDHHLSSDSLGNLELVDSTAAATGIIIYEFFKNSGWQITDEIAN